MSLTIILGASAYTSVSSTSLYHLSAAFYSYFSPAARSATGVSSNRYRHYSSYASALRRQPTDVPQHTLPQSSP